MRRLKLFRRCPGWASLIVSVDWFALDWTEGKLADSDVVLVMLPISA